MSYYEITVNRLEGEGLVRRQAAVGDRRKVDIVLTPKGTRAFERLAATHHAELARIGPQLRDFFEYVLGPCASTRAAGAAKPRGSASRGRKHAP